MFSAFASRRYVGIAAEAATFHSQGREARQRRKISIQRTPASWRQFRACGLGFTPISRQSAAHRIAFPSGRSGKRQTPKRQIQSTSPSDRTAALLNKYVLKASERTREEGRVVSAQQIMLEVLERSDI
jgi:hypothetical protein